MSEADITPKASPMVSLQYFLISFTVRHCGEVGGGQDKGGERIRSGVDRIRVGIGQEGGGRIRGWGSRRRRNIIA